MRYRRAGVAGSELTVDVFGAGPAELFENAGFAVFDVGYDLSNVPPTYSRPIVAPGDTLDELLRNWVLELLAWSISEGLIWSFFVVDRLEEGGVQGSASGLPVSQVPANRAIVGDVLGVTVHGVEAALRAEMRLLTVPRLRALE